MIEKSQLRRCHRRCREEKAGFHRSVDSRVPDICSLFSPRSHGANQGGTIGGRAELLLSTKNGVTTSMDKLDSTRKDRNRPPRLSAKGAKDGIRVIWLHNVGQFSERVELQRSAHCVGRVACVGRT